MINLKINEKLLKIKVFGVYFAKTPSNNKDKCYLKNSQ